MKKQKVTQSGQTLVEVLLAIALMALLLPPLFGGLITSREGKAQQNQRLQGATLMQEEEEAMRSVRESGWINISTDGTYHTTLSGSKWTLASGSETVNGFTRQVVISAVNRDAAGKIVSTGGTLDPSTKKIYYTVAWNNPYFSTVSATSYMTRYLDNFSYIQTSQTEFNTGILTQTQVTNVSGGEISLANNTKGKWCAPTLSAATIDLPDGPPVAVAATASATPTTPNDVFVATAPTDSTSVKLAYVTVPANVDPPAPSLHGTFTLDPSKYSSSLLVPPPSIGLDNNFKTNDVKLYKSPGGSLYALLATDRPDKEVVAILIKNSSGVDQYQDAPNKIYKYWTFFNTRMYQGNASSTPNQDRAPFGYGAVALTISGNKGYVASGGFLYAIDLSTIDSKSTANGLDMLGCRIELDGFDCQSGLGTDMKYDIGETGASWSHTALPAHNNCSDGGNIELYADHQLSAVQIGANTYIDVAVGAATDPELDVVDATTVPTNATNPKISDTACGAISGGNGGWKTISSLDFNKKTNTEEAANSVYSNIAGTRAYMSSNGGIDGNGDGKPDSDQFYVVNTSAPGTPAFLSGTSTTGATSGFYNGTTTNIQLFPRRSLTVLNGQRAILVGQDGVPNDQTEPQEYQVLDLTNEAAPKWCGGLNFSSGFNDLASVSEADGDNFVYLVANTIAKQLKIIQGGPDGSFLGPGTYESAVFDPGYSTVFNRYTATETVPANTTLQFQFAIAAQVGGSCVGANYVFTGPDGTASTYYTGSSAAIKLNPSGSGYINPGRCLKYRAYFSSTDNNSTATLYDMSINYSP